MRTDCNVAGLTSRVYDCLRSQCVRSVLSAFRSTQTLRNFSCKLVAGTLVRRWM